MAIGDKSDFTIYHDEFWGGMGEVLAQNAEAFNAASGNAIRLVTLASRGDYRRESFMKSISALSTRRDIEATTEAADTALVQDEMVSVKLNRRIGPVANTLDSFRKIAPNEDAQRLFSFQLGRQVAVAVQLDRLNSALIAAEAALDGVAAVSHDATDGTLQYTDLNSALALFGDRSSRIVTFVMHGKVFHNLFADALNTYKIDVVAGMQLVTGNPVTLGRNIVVTDSSALVSAATPTRYYTLGLVENAVEVIETEEQEIQEDVVTGLENLVLRIQGEHAFNVGVKGFKYDMANGLANPTNGTLGTSSNWDKVASNDKDLAGVWIESQ